MQAKCKIKKRKPTKTKMQGCLFRLPAAKKVLNSHLIWAAIKICIQVTLIRRARIQWIAIYSADSLKTIGFSMSMHNNTALNLIYSLLAITPKKIISSASFPTSFSLFFLTVYIFKEHKRSVQRIPFV